MNEPAELDAVRQRYDRRRTITAERYSMLNPEVLARVQERERALARLLRGHHGHDLGALTLVEVGCGAGGNLLELLRLGFAPAHLQGLELLPERHALARAVLPAALPLHLGDACVAPVGDASCDLVLQSTVFSSLLDDAFQQRLADTMWRWVKPGGAVLWYDFAVDNPRNLDVRGVPLSRVRALFPQARLQSQRVTLAPPLARWLCRWHPGLYPLANALPLLRTHRLVWLGKPVR